MIRILLAVIFIISFNWLIAETNNTDSKLNNYIVEAEALIGEEKYDLAIDNIINALEIENNTTAYMQMIGLPNEQTDLLLSKLSKKTLENPVSADWFYYIGKVYYHEKSDYKSAMEAFEKAYAIDNKSVYLTLIEDCRNKLSE